MSSPDPLQRPLPPRPDFPLKPHASGKWYVRVKGRVLYFGRWEDPAGAEAEYLRWLQKGKRVAAKTKKPYPDFPLTPHEASGKWCVKIRRKLHYFGRLNDPQGALDEFKVVEADLRAGRIPTVRQGLTWKGLGNAWLNAKAALVPKELKASTLADYQGRTNEITEIIGGESRVQNLGPADFDNLRKKLSEHMGLVRLTGYIVVTRMIVRYAEKRYHISMDMGPDFKRPSAKSLRRERAKKPPRFFKPGEFRRLLKAAKQPLKAMLLLALNCGFSNADCAGLRIEDVKADSPWLKVPRAKTDMPRVCYLWPKTRTALREAVAQRPKAKSPEDEGLVFVTKYGNSFARTADRGCQIAKETRKLLLSTGVYRVGLNFGALRHTFLSVAEDNCSKTDVDLCMGHRSDRRDPEIELILGSAPRPSDMSANYRENRRKGALTRRLKRVARAVYDYAFTRRARAKNRQNPPVAPNGEAVPVAASAAASPPAGPESSPTPRKKSGSGAALRRASKPR